MPLSAVFIIFDFVIHNPGHKETSHNINLLDKAAEFFGQIDYASQGGLPGNVISRFTGIAREYVLNLSSEMPATTVPNSQMLQGIQPIWDYAPDIDFNNMNSDVS
jgi:hypothetical protein